MNDSPALAASTVSLPRLLAVLIPAMLLVPIAILAGFNVWSLGPIMDGFSIPAANDGVAAWSFWGQVASFWVWGLSLAIATAAYGWATRGDD